MPHESIIKMTLKKT